MKTPCSAIEHAEICKLIPLDNNTAHVRTLLPTRRTNPISMSQKPLSSLLPVSRRLDEMLAPEVRPEVHDLPRTQPNQHRHRPNCKPLDALIRALIRIPQLLLTGPQIVHLRDNFADRLLNAPQLRLDRLQLLASRNGVPVLGIGSYVDVELDVARLVRLGRACEDVLEADVEGGVFVRGEGVAVFADDIFRAVVVVAHGVADLV